MPYHWSETSQVDKVQTLTLWPHQSLPPKGLAAFVLATFTMITLPLFGLLGTKLLWGLLPFLMIAVLGVWYALSRSQKDRSILEVLNNFPRRNAACAAQSKNRSARLDLQHLLGQTDFAPKRRSSAKLCHNAWQWPRG